MLLCKLLVFYGYLCSWLLGFSVAQGDNNGLITAPTNETVYIGQSVNFYSETHSSCNIRTYVNGRVCTTTNGQSVSNTVGSITYSNCSIYNTQLSDDGTRIVVRVYCHKITSFGPVYLQVIGPPHSPLNLTIEQYCDMIVITGPVLSEDTTEVYIEIQRDNDTTFNITKSAFPVNISAAVFEDHNERYRIIVYNKNLAGLSQPYEKDLLFKTVFDISSSSLQIINKKIIMTITVQVNISCPLSVPQQFNLSSNCLNNNFYRVINGTTIIESGLIDLSLILHPNKINCTISVSSGDHELYIINQNTYEVQEVSISEDTSTGYFSVYCTFLPGSQVKGCAIEVVNNDSGEYIFDQKINRLSPTSLYAVDNSSTCLTNNGTYMIYVYIWDKYGRVNKSLVVTTKRVRVAISYQEDKNDNISINGTTTTSNDKEPDDHDVIDGTNNVVIGIILCVVFYRRHNKRGTLDIETPSYHYEGMEGRNLSNGHIQQNEELCHGSLHQEECPNQESETAMNMIDHKTTTNNVDEELLPNDNGLPNKNGDYISPEADTHDHDNNTLKRSSGTYKPEVPPASDLSVTGITDDSEVPLINNTPAHEIGPKFDTQLQQNIAVSTQQNVTSTGVQSSIYPTSHNSKTQLSKETPVSKIISGIKKHPHVRQSVMSQLEQSPVSESPTFPTDSSKTDDIADTKKIQNTNTQLLHVGQRVVSQPEHSHTSDSATFPTVHSGAPLLKPDDDIDDQFEYLVDEPEVNNQTALMEQVAPQLSAISEKDKHVFSFENVATTSGGAQPVVIDEPFQTIYSPPTLKPHPLDKSAIVNTFPTTPTTNKEFFVPTKDAK